MKNALPHHLVRPPAKTWIYAKRRSRVRCGLTLQIFTLDTVHKKTTGVGHISSSAPNAACSARAHTSCTQGTTDSQRRAASPHHTCINFGLMLSVVNGAAPAQQKEKFCSLDTDSPHEKWPRRSLKLTGFCYPVRPATGGGGGVKVKVHRTQRGNMTGKTTFTHDQRRSQNDYQVRSNKKRPRRKQKRLRRRKLESKRGAYA